MCRFAFLGLFFCSFAFADYAWITEAQHLQIRLGADFFSTGNNYANDGLLDAARVSGQTVTLIDHTFFLEPEFGIAPDWALNLRLPFIDGVVENDVTNAMLLSGTGFGDIRGGLKWRFSQRPLWTAELFFKIPSGNAVSASASELVLGEGNLDLGLKLHYGFRTGNFFFSASPGILGRFGGYSSAFVGDLAAQLFFYRAYAKLLISSIVSFSAQALPPSTVSGQSLQGTGGSYARLAASPTGVSALASLGVLITKDWRVEAGFSRAVVGARYPDFVSFNVSLLGTFDFSSPDLRPKIREVPFETPPEGA